jgi:hypothetical protein
MTPSPERLEVEKEEAFSTKDLLRKSGRVDVSGALLDIL